MNNLNLTKREIDIMNIFWKENRPLIASDFPKFDSSLTINTVQAYLKKLKEKGLIEVADIVYSGTVLTRSYKFTVNQDEFEAKKYLNSINSHKINVSSLVATFLNTQDEDTAREEITNLEKLIQKQKKLLKEKSSKENEDK